MASLATTKVRTPAGRVVEKVDLTAGVGAPGTAQVLAAIIPGGELFGRSLVMELAPGATAMGTADRETMKTFYSKLAECNAPLAMVSASLPFRLALKGVILLSPYAGPLKICESEAAALRWFDELPAAS